VLPHVSFGLAVILCATLFALLEIQIEGSRGWATGLPTWRVENRVTRLVLGDRALTGYHLYIHLFLLAVLHLPYALFLTPLSWSAELRIGAFLVLFWIVEDFLWFVLNPRFGIRRFQPDDAWWHAPSWWWIMPREYWLFTPVGIGLYLASWLLA